MKTTRKFLSSDKKVMLVLQAHEGKKGFNFHVSRKEVTAKDEPTKKAETGMREQFKTSKEALEAVELAAKGAVKKGWTEVLISKKNAFTEIPEAPKAPEAPKPTAVKRSA